MNIHIKFIISCLFLLGSISLLNAQNVEKLFKKAEKGSDEAQYELSMLFKQSLELKQPLEKLKEYYLKENFYSDSKELDTLLLEDYWFWVNENYLYNLTESAEKGNDLAQYELGKHYESQNDFGCELRAYKWMLKSAKQKNQDAGVWIQHQNETLYLKKYLLREDYEGVDFFVNLLDLSNSLCYIFYQNWQDKEVGSKVEKKITEFLNLKEGDPANKSKIVDFWNTYNKFFICLDDLDESYITYTHILKKSLISLSFTHNQQLFDWLFELNKTKPVDFNQIIYFDNKPKTILDELSSICRNPMLYEHIRSKDVCELGNKLIDQYNAKTAFDLLKE